MQFLKNHYEKIILSLVLVGLVVAVSILFVRVGKVKTAIRTSEQQLEQVANKPVALRDRKPYEEALMTATNPPNVDLSQGHLVFNPFKWVVDAQGKIIKVDREDKLGAGAIRVSSVTNFDFVMTLDRITGTAESPTYLLTTLHQGKDRSAVRHYARPGVKTRDFNYGEGKITLTVKEAKGDPLMPEELLVELERSEEMGGLTPVSVAMGKPYVELMGRQVDLLYPPENRAINGVKLNDSITLGADTYNVIAITDKQIIFESQSKKRTYINYAPAVP